MVTIWSVQFDGKHARIAKYENMTIDFYKWGKLYYDWFLSEQEAINFLNENYGGF